MTFVAWLLASRAVAELAIGTGHHDGPDALV